MAALFRDVPEALATTLEIAEKCDLKIELGKSKFPEYAAPEGETREGYLRRLCFEGLERRFKERAQEPALRERLDFELSANPGSTCVLPRPNCVSLSRSEGVV